jgi:hypothetical protein
VPAAGAGHRGTGMVGVVTSLLNMIFNKSAIAR